jgi:hypothetical protein
MKNCSKTGCSRFAVYTVSLPPKDRTPLNACGNHLTWAVQFLGGPGVRANVDVL